jgi:hypothetical protein
MKAQTLYDGINEGKTLCIGTAYKTTKINQKTVNSWKKAGYEVLKDGKDGEDGFYIGRGKNYDYVTPMGCRVYWELP